jgi:hypothetical protein
VKKWKVVGESVIVLKELFDKARTQDMSFNLLEDGKKKKGDLILRNCSLRNFYTFLDLHIKNALNLVPIIAVDYSLANLTFDENCYCIHTLKQGAPNDYVDCLKRICKSYKLFSKFMLSYGFGARTVNGEGPACNLFSMTGDFMDPFVDGEEELYKSYVGTIKSVKLGLPVFFKEIIKLVCDLA